MFLGGQPRGPRPNPKEAGPGFLRNFVRETATKLFKVIDQTTRDKNFYTVDPEC